MVYKDSQLLGGVNMFTSLTIFLYIFKCAYIPTYIHVYVSKHSEYLVNFM